MLTGLVHRVVRAVVGTVVRRWYPHMALYARERLPHDRPWVLVPNHPNGLVDGVVLQTLMPRRLVFLAKAPFFRSPPGRLLLEAFGAVPVMRRHEAGAESRAHANAAAFARVLDLLRAGCGLVVFPEGTTRASTTPGPLRTGAARVALDAAADGTVLVPLGIWYLDPTRPRTPLAVVAAPPIALHPVAGQLPLDAHALTATLAEALAGVTAQAVAVLALQTLGVAVPQPLPVPQAGADRPARAAALHAHLLALAADLRAAGIAHVTWLASAPPRYAPVAAVLLALPALPGLALGYLPVRLARVLAARITHGRRRQTATTTMLVTVALLGGTWGMAALLAVRRAGPRGGVALLLPPVLSAAALHWIEALAALRATWALHRLQQADPARLAALERRRQALVDEALRLIHRGGTHGPGSEWPVW